MFPDVAPGPVKVYADEPFVPATYVVTGPDTSSFSLIQLPPCAKYSPPVACTCATAPWYVEALGRSLKAA